MPAGLLGIQREAELVTLGIGLLKPKKSRSNRISGHVRQKPSAKTNSTIGQIRDPHVLANPRPQAPNLTGRIHDPMPQK